MGRQSRVLVVLVAILACVLVSGTGNAQIPDANGIINGCYNRANGQLKVIDPTVTSCSGNQEPISWRQLGDSGYQIVEVPTTVPVDTVIAVHSRPPVPRARRCWAVESRFTPAA